MFQDALHGLLKASGRATPRRRTASSESTQSGDGREKQNTEENEQIAVDMLVAFGLQDQLTKGDVSESFDTGFSQHICDFSLLPSSLTHLLYPNTDLRKLAAFTQSHHPLLQRQA